MGRVRRKGGEKGMAVRTRPGKWQVQCPVCRRPRIVAEGRFTVIHNCLCGTVYRAECNGDVNLIAKRGKENDG